MYSKREMRGGTRADGSVTRLILEGHGLSVWRAAAAAEGTHAFVDLKLLVVDVQVRRPLGLGGRVTVYY